MKAVLFLFLLVAITATAQSKKQKQIEAAFVKYYCSCLSDIAKADPEQILYTRTEVCVRKFFSDYAALAAEIINEDYHIDSLTEYQRGRLLGTSIIQNTVDDLVKDCQFYRQTLSEFKQLMLDQARVKKEDVLKKAEEMKGMEAEMKTKDKKSLATFYTLIGILYEFGGNTKMALSYYDKSMSTQITTSAKGLRAALKLEK